MKYSPAMDSSVQDEKMKYKCKNIYTVDSKSFHAFITSRCNFSLNCFKRHVIPQILDLFTHEQIKSYFNHRKNVLFKF